jgi:tetratricopeptide (TPR) repeat protein
VQESFQGLFKFLDENGATYNIDRDKLGVYAASANSTASGTYLMSDKAYKGIKAAVLYYGSAPASPFRKDLPVLFVIAEGDVARNGYATLWSDVLKNKAPWTIMMGSALPHGFDAFTDSDEARKVVKETISFWKNQLEPIAPPSWSYSLPREAVAASYMHDDNKAANLAMEWLKTHPSDAGALRMFAWSTKNARRYEEAETAYRKLGIHEDNAFEMMDFAQILYGNKKPDEAAKYVAKAEKVGNVPRFQYVILGSLLYNQKNYPLSAEYYEKALALQPTSVDYYNLACTYALGNEKDKAFACLNKAIEFGGTSKQQYEGDADLNSLHGDARWKGVLEKLR